jgi:hypothetical protein
MHILRLAFSPRFVFYTLSILLTCTLLLTVVAYPPTFHLAIVPLAMFIGLTIIGTHDLIQTRHAVLRNYPISAHLRFLLEDIRPEMRWHPVQPRQAGGGLSARQDGARQASVRNQYDVYGEGFGWVRHSIMPRPLATARSASRSAGRIVRGRMMH